MKTPDRFSPDDPREWLNRARSNLAQAIRRSPEVYVEDCCNNAQQAAEKAIKGIMLLRSLEVLHTHDLGALLSLLAEFGEQIPEEIRQAEELTPYAVQSRYPNYEEPVSEDELRNAVRIAKNVVQWAESLI